MKMKEKTKKRIQGSISVMLVIILLPMMTFSSVIVDLSRLNMAKQMMSSAGDLTMNTALANYDTILKDVYGLFAMSQTKGMTNDELGTELNQYFAKTLSAYGVVPEKDSEDYVATLIGDFRDLLNGGKLETNNFLQLDNISVNATKVENSSLTNASVMRKQIVEYMKYRAPLELGMSFLESLTSFDKMDAQNTVVSAQVTAQESTQDVTKACQKLIKMIRAYDKRIEEINNALKGVTGNSDTAVIPLEDYDSHPTKYLVNWAENYTHINRLNLVFLANSPSADSVYLKELSVPGECYVGTDGTIYSGSKNVGFSVSPALSAGTAEAQNQVYAQIQNLNTNHSGIKTSYASSILPSNLLTFSGGININNVTLKKENEEQAIKKFIQFEQFLLDQSETVKYSQVQEVLKQIAILNSYRANFETEIGKDIAAAVEAQTQAQNALNALISTRDTAAGAMNDRINYINNRINSYVSGYESLDDALDFLGSGNKENEIKSALNQLPTRNIDYASYYNAYIASGDSDVYLKYFKWLVNDSSFGGGTTTQKNIIKAAKAFANEKGWDANGFDDYMKGKLSAIEENADLFKLLSCLKTCHAYAITYKNNISVYTDAANQIPEAQRVLNEATQKVNALNGQKTKVVNDVKFCQQGFHTFCNAYQSDAYYYNYYIAAVKNTIGPEALKIQTHFAQLIAYVLELRTDLDEISKQITNVKTAIDTYQTNLNNWETANNTYESSKGGDSFSGQTADDIEKARTEYNTKLYDTLDTFVISIWNEFDDLYTKLTEKTNFVYGSKRIDEIKSADDLITAVSKIALSDVVTKEEAEGKLSSLYKGETVEYNPYTMDYTTPKQLCFLSPTVLQIQALKYLNSAYPDDSKLTSEEKESNKTVETDYENTKKQLKGEKKAESTDSKDSDKSKTESGEKKETSTGFGYTYSGKKVTDNAGTKDATSTANLPSTLAGKKAKDSVSDSQYVLTETGEGDDAKMNPSGGVSGQNSKSSGFLSKLGNIATAAVENLYILTYIFENFSYNTIVQEQILKDNKDETSYNSIFTQVANAKTKFSSTVTKEDGTSVSAVEAAKEKITTLSNYNINGTNNYLYGAEVEYILFGNKTAKTNVTSVKGSIYAIRFGFNCIYAFTNSEIRNSTMAAGLAVQAATLGVVPYQVVQIVLQLALAAAESAIDLDAMNQGLSVAIVKTKDTWSLSASGAAEALKDAGKAAANMVANKATELATNAISGVTTGLNNLLDAGADELKGALYDLETNMTSAAEGVLEGVMDDVLASVMSKIEEGLNELQNVNAGSDQLPTKAEVRAKAVTLFQNVRGELSAIISDACGGNEMAKTIADKLKVQADSLINDMETEVLNAIDTAGDVDITGFIAEKLNGFKLRLIELGNGYIASLRDELNTMAESAISSTTDQLKGYISQCGDNLSEEAAKAIKDQVSSFTDNFVNTTLKVNGSSAAADVKSSPVSMFKFGYKDYLMLLTYIAICCDGDDVLARTADVVQMNLQTSKEFAHEANKNKGKFLMSKAYTYVSISADAELDMFFMDMSIFADQVADDTTDPETGTETTTESKGTKISYKGILGY